VGRALAGCTGAQGAPNVPHSTHLGGPPVAAIRARRCSRRLPSTPHAAHPAPFTRAPQIFDRQSYHRLSIAIDVLRALGLVERVKRGDADAAAGDTGVSARSALGLPPCPAARPAPLPALPRPAKAVAPPPAPTPAPAPASPSLPPLPRFPPPPRRRRPGLPRRQARRRVRQARPRRRPHNARALRLCRARRVRRRGAALLLELARDDLHHAGHDGHGPRLRGPVLPGVGVSRGRADRVVAQRQRAQAARSAAPEGAPRGRAGRQDGRRARGRGGGGDRRRPRRGGLPGCLGAAELGRGQEGSMAAEPGVRSFHACPRPSAPHPNPTLTPPHPTPRPDPPSAPHRSSACSTRAASTSTRTASRAAWSRCAWSTARARRGRASAREGAPLTGWGWQG
jgi:hypothetical protein